MIARIKASLSRWRRVPLVHERFDATQRAIRELERRVDRLQETLGRIEYRQLTAENNPNLIDNEFRAFSQWGEDGIIQFLIRHINIDRKIFVEFGADFYNLESNTRFLLTNNNWAGLVIDSSEIAIEELKHSNSCVMYELKAISAFITRDNINNLLSENGITGEIGLLSIDVDGNDYWIWEAISVIDPVIVVIEYNHRFGSDLAVTIPYQADFERGKAHPSKLYFGASLKALCNLGNSKGYEFVGCNSNGVNAFFVRKDKKPAFLKTFTPEEAFVPGKFGEPFEKEGEFFRLAPAEESTLLLSLPLPLINVEEAGE